MREVSIPATRVASVPKTASYTEKTEKQLASAQPIVIPSMLSGIIYYLYRWQSEYRIIIDFEMIGILFAAVIAISAVINVLSGRFAIRKFLRMDAEDLYY